MGKGRQGGCRCGAVRNGTRQRRGHHGSPPMGNVVGGHIHTVHHHCGGGGTAWKVASPRQNGSVVTDVSRAVGSKIAARQAGRQHRHPGCGKMWGGGGVNPPERCQPHKSGRRYPAPSSLGSLVSASHHVPPNVRHRMGRNYPVAGSTATPPTRPVTAGSANTEHSTVGAGGW